VATDGEEVVIMGVLDEPASMVKESVGERGALCCRESVKVRSS